MRLRAYALPMVLVLVALLVAALGLFLQTSDGAARSATRLFRRQQAQVALQGTTRAAAVATGQFLFSKPAQPDPMPSDAAAAEAALHAHFEHLRDDGNVFLSTLKPSLTPTGMILDRLEIATVAARTSGQVQEGAFRGMNALIQPFDLEVEAHHDSMRDGSTVRLHAQAERIFIPMFQFFAFIDGYAFVFNGPGAKFSGRVHANDNMCLGTGGTNTTFFETITSAGKIYKLKGSGCRNEKSGSGGSVLVSKDGFPDPFDATAFASLLKDADSPTWVSDINLWKGAVAHVADSTHGIPRLKPPITGTPLTQRGRNALHTAVANNDNSRFLVDPLLPSESLDIARQKMAFKADIRIIDGIWYLRDPARPLELGTPIWSDHPGHMTTSSVDDRWSGAAVQVGQDDLFPGARPKRFSHYQTAAPGSALLATPDFSKTPVVSYGALERVAGSPPRWVPGFFKSAAAASCPDGTFGSTPSTICYPVAAADAPARLLQGTRSGFRSAWDESGLTSGAADCAASAADGLTLRLASVNLGGTTDARRSPLVNMLPINFDISGFQAALNDHGSNELGSFFGGGRTFNGVVYISATWPGFRDGFGVGASSTLAKHWPFQGLQADAFSGEDTADASKSQPKDVAYGSGNLVKAETYAGLAYSGNVAEASRKTNSPFQQALPYPLCSDSFAGAATGKLATYSSSASDFSAGAGRSFYVPLCSRYRESNVADRIHARINAVRIINGSNLNPAVLPEGLTVISNLPVFIVGSLNTTSGTAAVPTALADKPTESTVTPWSPVLIGGDTLSLLSNAFRDDEIPWNVPAGAYYDARIPTDTQINGAFLYGWAEAAKNPATGVGCRDELTYSIRLHERWDAAAGIRRVVRGSIFVGWNSVYGSAFSNVHQASASGAWHDTDGSTKIYGYDYHFDQVAQQPPGAPQFELTNIKRVLDE